MTDLFKPLTLEDRPLFNDYLSRYSGYHSEYNFATLFIWNSVYQYKWAIIDKALVIWISTLDVLLMPLGVSLTVERLKEISEHFREKGHDVPFILVEPAVVAEMPKIKEHFSVRRERELADYMYNTEDLAELKGRKYQKKRNLINQFERNYPEYHSKEMDESVLHEYWRLAERWCRETDCHEGDFEEEMAALSNAFKNFHELSLGGVNLCSDDRLLAFSLFSKQNPEMYTVHFEKTDPRIKGVGQVINRETAKYILHHDPVPYINREQDLGREGLRKAKRSYHPVRIYQTVQLIPKQKIE